MELKQFLKDKGEKAELQYLREMPDYKYGVKLSSFGKLRNQVTVLIELLDDLYEAEQKGDEVFLKFKVPNKLD